MCVIYFVMLYGSFLCVCVRAGLGVVWFVCLCNVFVWVIIDLLCDGIWSVFCVCRCVFVCCCVYSDVFGWFACDLMCNVALCGCFVLLW